MTQWVEEVLRENEEAVREFMEELGYTAVYWDGKLHHFNRPYQPGRQIREWPEAREVLASLKLNA